MAATTTAHGSEEDLVDRYGGALSFPLLFFHLWNGIKKRNKSNHSHLQNARDIDTMESFLDLYIYSQLVTFDYYARNATRALTEARASLTKAVEAADPKTRERSLRECRDHLEIGKQLTAKDSKTWSLVNKQRGKRNRSLKWTPATQYLQQQERNKNGALGAVATFEMQASTARRINTWDDSKIKVVLNLACYEPKLGNGRALCEGYVRRGDRTGLLATSFFGRQAELDHWAQMYQLERGSDSDPPEDIYCKFMVKTRTFDDYAPRSYYPQAIPTLEIYLVWRRSRYQVVMLVHPPHKDILTIECSDDVQKTIHDTIEQKMASITTQQQGENQSQAVIWKFMSQHFKSFEGIERDNSRKEALAKYWRPDGRHPHPHPITAVVIVREN